MSQTERKLPARILDEATTWFIEYSEGTLDHGAHEEFMEWLRTSPDHVRAYLEISAIWEGAASIKSRLTADELLALARREGNVVQIAGPPVPASPSSGLPKDTVNSGASNAQGRRAGTFRRLILMAASLLIAIGAIWHQVYRAPTYSTDVGEQRSIRLSDGSTIAINSRSEVRVRFSEHERLVELLEGQALFSVAKDSTRPFVVASNDTRVRAVGTRFDVYQRRAGTVVTVVEGQVVVGSPLIKSRHPVGEASDAASLSPPQAPLLPSEAEAENIPTGTQSSDPPDLHTPFGRALVPGGILLAAGQRLTVSAVAAFAPETANIEAATAWTRREIVFQASTLSEVIEEFNRYNPKKMVIADPSLQNTRISGVFSSTDPHSLLRFLHDLPNFDVQEKEDEIRIARK